MFLNLTNNDPFQINFLKLFYILMFFAKTNYVRLCLDQLLQYIHMLMEILKIKILLLLCKCILVIHTFVHFYLRKCFFFILPYIYNAHNLKHFGSLYIFRKLFILARCQLLLTPTPCK